ncbi:MAG TPA: hypothetical protein VFE36_02550 [Candidatus Baltobacteraceae bacterium]|nr:hypothetical protein [Candidatus Baltobacteraceae bacterium]
MSGTEEHGRNRERDPRSGPLFDEPDASAIAGTIITKEHTSAPNATR